MIWEPVVGLEIHAQLSTRSKIFSGAPTAAGADPNTQACPIDLGLPGVLPVLNEEALRMAVMFGVATNAEIATRSVFARKNYFYPDLPKGYQISQYDLPIVSRGEIQIELDDGSSKRIRITRAHLEEDAGKSLHDAYPDQTGVDLNRAGVPLLEIVSDPDMRSPSEATAYMRSIHSMVRYLGICDGNMQDGSLRCDANVSVRRRGDSILGTRTEIKNLNSFRFVERAITYEIARQIEVLENHGTVLQETRLYDAATGETRAMRGKEEANDYRYFPDPDLLPVEITSEYIERIRANLPELPAAKVQRFRSDYDLPDHDARRLTFAPDVADYYEQVAKASRKPKLAANWIIVELAAALHRDGLEITRCPIRPRRSLYHHHLHRRRDPFRQDGQIGVRGSLARRRRSAHHNSQEGSESDFRFRHHRPARGPSHRRTSFTGRAIPSRKRKTSGILRRTSNESDRWAGKPGKGQSGASSQTVVPLTFPWSDTEP